MVIVPIWLLFKNVKLSIRLGTVYSYISSQQDTDKPKDSDSQQN